MNCLLCLKKVHPYYLMVQLIMLSFKQPAICQSCAAQFEKLIVNCQRCGGGQMLQSSVCDDCLSWEKEDHLVSHQALFRYNQAMKDYFSTYKFNGDYRLRFVFANDFSATISNSYRDYLIVPIPISKERLASRGFNQVIGLLDAAEIKYTCLLEKPVEMVAQSSRTRAERLKIGQPFEMNSNLKIDQRQKVLLVDDIYTTGNTLYLATSRLKQAGFKHIATFSLAR